MRDETWLDMSMELVSKLDNWFADQLQTIECSPEARAYIVRVYAENGSQAKKQPKLGSVVLAYAAACDAGDFVAYQELGDWALWVSTFAQPGDKQQLNVVETLGRMSYRSCFRILNKKWKLYEELADNLPEITKSARCSLMSFGVVLFHEKAT